MVTTKTDNVNSPEHYKQPVDDLTAEVRKALFGDDSPVQLEAIEAISCMLSIEELRGYLRGNSLKYRWRYLHKKNPIEDLKKAKWYEDKLLYLEEVIDRWQELKSARDACLETIFR